MRGHEPVKQVLEINEFYDDSDQSRQRCRRRLREELLLDDESIEIILRLRSELLVAQRVVVGLQGELAVYRSERGMRLTDYRGGVVEASWRQADLPDQE